MQDIQFEEPKNTFSLEKFLKGLTRKTKHEASKKGHRHMKGRGAFPKGMKNEFTNHQRVVLGRAERVDKYLDKTHAEWLEYFMN